MSLKYLLFRRVQQLEDIKQRIIKEQLQEEIIEQPFDDSFEWHYLFGPKLIDSNCLGALDKNFHGVNEKLTYQNTTNLLHETFFRDMEILLNCYANNFIPEIWKDILYVYQHNGLPCGWKGDYPEGKMIVFSNE